MRFLINIGILFATQVLYGGQGIADLSPIFPKLQDGLPGYEDIPQLMSTAALACKGEVIFAPEPSFDSGNTPRMTGVAFVRLDRCFKGRSPNPTVSVRFDAVLPSEGHSWHAFILRTGEYRFLFLRPFEGRYILVDQFYGALPVSRMCRAEIEDSDPLWRLELDLKEGFQDQDPEGVLSNIQLLGNMKQLRSNVELKAFVNSSDPLRRIYSLEALLKLKDYSVLGEVVELFDSLPPHGDSFLLPADRLPYMESRLFYQVGFIRDPSTVPYLERFALSLKPRLRKAALDALRAMGNPQSAPVFLKELDDSSPDNAFSAMHALLELAGPGPSLDWIPSRDEFLRDPPNYAARCREWWQSDGERRMIARTAR